MRSAPRISRRASSVALVLVSLGLAGIAQLTARPDRAEGAFSIVEAGHGFGTLLPHRVPVPDAQGLPTPEIVEIRSLGDLANVRPTNPVLPQPSWPATSVLPNGEAGNHFVYVRFDQVVDVDSVLTSAASAAARANLLGSIRVIQVDSSGRVKQRLRGRAFLGGRTYGSVDPQNPSQLLLESWVRASAGGNLVAVDPRGVGFPGTEGNGFAGAALLAAPSTFVFVADTDGDLSTHETFPANVHVQVLVGKEVRSRLGATLAERGLASATVGPDLLTPGIRPGLRGVPLVIPADGATGVDPRTNIQVFFSEPVQPLTVGKLPGGPPGLSPSFQITFGPPAAPMTVPFTATPVSPYDLGYYQLDPAFDFPGSGAGAPDCASFSQVHVALNPNSIEDLPRNRNAARVETSFETVGGVGLVNAPVTPDTIYVGRAGASSGLSVIDLNGFGAGTGNPTYDMLHPIVEGNSNFPNNPNLRLQGALLVPPLAAGTCTTDGGSSGVFSLTRSSSLSDLLIGPPLLESVADMALGHALDITFNASAPFGCQVGGGNVCAATGLKLVQLSAGGPNSVVPTPVGELPFKVVFGAENIVSWAPHPNPPPLVFPPLCVSPWIGGLEPTALMSTLTPPEGPGLTNLLSPGPLSQGDPSIELPPQNLLALEQNTFFQGPTPPQPLIANCERFAMRQQIGQFLYVADRVAGQIVVLNSNRFLVLDRIAVTDPTSLAMSPNLDLLAITSETANQVSFLDVDPASPTFHTIVQVTPVGAGPTGIAWEPGNEDILVCNTAGGTVSVISAFTLQVRKTLTRELVAPIDVAITPRQMNYSFGRGVYFAYVLDAGGAVALFESGPDGPNGWGYDDIVARLPIPFARPKAIQPDVHEINSAVWVLHEDPLASDGQPTGQPGGAATLLGIVGGTLGIQPLDPGQLDDPHLRDLEFGVRLSFGEGQDGLSGIPVDLAFDDQVNLGALTNFSTQFSAGQPLSVNGKSLVKFIPPAVLPAKAPQFLFLAVPGAGVIDVLRPDTFPVLERRVDTNVFQPGSQSIPATGVAVLMDYFRQ